MNTQTHVIVNLALLRFLWFKRKLAGVVVFGSIYPDLGILFFWVVNSLAGVSQRYMWDVLYFSASWQVLFSLLNSIPIALVLLAIGYARKHYALILFSASLLLHYLQDFFVHTADAYAYFYPLSWRFESSLSYWDSSSGAGWFSVFEFGLILVAAWYLRNDFKVWWAKTLLILSVILSAAVPIFFIL